MKASNAILTGLIDGVVHELLPKTTGGNVVLEDGSALTEKLIEVVMTLNEKAKTADVETLIEQAKTAVKDEIIDGAPAAYDTLKEIADYLATHKDEYTALLATIGGKAEKSAVEAIKATVDGLGALAVKDKVAEADLDTALAAKVNAAAQGNHSHTNKTVLDGVTAEKVTEWEGKSKVTIGKTQPGDMQPGDLFIQIS
ncbi:hypothetical protein V1225_01670 [Emergencia sp. JLR.KK010]|uniref:hypothetical protein n=1 Tax=Emergencia sp. JLR.KK010 TaxID=3114296 RepID=UPI0030D2CF38